MQSRIIRTVNAFRWQQWLVLAVFLLVAGFTGFKAVRMVHAVRYWRAHRDEPIRGWMNVRHVAHSYRVPPRVLYLALGLPETAVDRRPLREIAKIQHRSVNELRTILQNAIMQARAPQPAPPDQSPDTGRSP